MSTVNRSVRDLLERRGIDPNLEVPPPEPFDPVAHRLEAYTGRLEREVPAIFAEARADHPQVRAWLARHLADPTDAPWLMLTGNTGTGKTHQAYGLLREIALAAARANRRCRWRFTTHPNLNAEMRPKPDESHTFALEPYLEADLLILDDVGAGKQSDFTSETLTRLVDHRWAGRLPTVYTTNLTADQLEQAVGDRVLSRMADATVVALTGPDRRWERGASA